MTTSVITFLEVYVTMGFPIEIMFIFKVIKSILKGHMINRILHSWSFHMKFMKLAEGAYHKFHIK